MLLNVLLGGVREVRWEALRASTLSLGTAGLTGPGRIPAFHWADAARLAMVTWGSQEEGVGVAQSGRV